jgi:hypothetical protein
MRNVTQISLGIAALCMAFSATAQKPVVYPSKGQSTQQQGKDDGECYGWAKQSTGMIRLPLGPGDRPGNGRRAVRARSGRSRWLAIGAIAGDAGRGAAIGAVVGTMAGGRRARQNQEAQNQQAQAQHQQQIDTFYRAYGACMEGRGYTIR